jgi:anti-sigma regulatory factor (Ser/Thr protein kinase)
VKGDESRLMQVLSNMISNAAKFSSDGGEVTVGAKPAGGTIRIFVTDHGAGIPPGAKEKVFGRFTQLDSSDQRRTGGTGLGMNISREIVEAMGGTIDYESELGVGTTFFVDLPRLQVNEANPTGAVDFANGSSPFQINLQGCARSLMRTRKHGPPRLLCVGEFKGAKPGAIVPGPAPDTASVYRVMEVWSQKHPTGGTGE